MICTTWGPWQRQKSDQFLK